MARLKSMYRILTLQNSLEEIMRLGDEYLISEAWEEWRARDLLAWLEEHHPDLLERALKIERNAQAKLTSVKGLGRSYAWETYVTRRRELPLLDACGCC